MVINKAGGASSGAFKIAPSSGSLLNILVTANFNNRGK